MRFYIIALLACALGFGAPATRKPQPDEQAVQPHDQFFSGIITQMTDSSVTVTRTVLGKQSAVRTFAITPDTRIEGKPKLKSKVTVRFVTDEEGDQRAIHIIVRNSQTRKQP